MKIHSFSYFDKEYNRVVEHINLKDLTLLVGASGVGKTEILRSIRSIKRIAEGASFNGVSWSICFSIGEDTYTWEGEFELVEEGVLVSMSKNREEDDKTDDEPTIIYEKVVLNDEVLLEREGIDLTFKGTKSPVPIKAEQSVLTLIPDPLIQKAEREFEKIIYSDYTDSAQGFKNVRVIDEKILKKYKNIDDLRNSDENIIAKLLWVYKKKPEIFDDIKDDFTSIFPQVVDLKIDVLEMLKSTDMPIFIKATPFIQFKENEMKDWAPIMSMSAGMYRTLTHIMELYLSAEGTIILIDEFENSLGVNCIDELTTIMKGAVGRIQFIITSHHPYIINNIHYKNWKIVTRNGGKVSTQDADDFMGKSKHEAFIQLINHPSYKTGKSYA